MASVRHQAFDPRKPVFVFFEILYPFPSILQEIRELDEICNRSFCLCYVLLFVLGFTSWDDYS